MRIKFVASLAATGVLLVNVASAGGPSAPQQPSVDAVKSRHQVQDPPIILTDISQLFKRPLITAA